MSDNLAPFRDAKCTCRDMDSGGKEIVETCELHGRGTDYWAEMTAEWAHIEVGKYGPAFDVTSVESNVAEEEK